MVAFRIASLNKNRNSRYSFKYHRKALICHVSIRYNTIQYNKLYSKSERIKQLDKKNEQYDIIFNLAPRFIGWVIALNATFNKISVISWRSVLLVEETGVPWENHRPWQVTDQLYNNIVSSTPRHERDSNSQRLHR